jgi:hypothetical protein
LINRLELEGMAARAASTRDRIFPVLQLAAAYRLRFRSTMGEFARPSSTVKLPRNRQVECVLWAKAEAEVEIEQNAKIPICRPLFALA